MNYLKLNNGRKIPSIGMGTYKGDSLENVVKECIHMGYRMFDTAFVYANEADIGKALESKIKDGSVKREDLFVISKLWNTKHQVKDVLPSLKKSLADLRLEYVDLYLMHWPFATVPDKGNEMAIHSTEEDLTVTIEETWKAMEHLVDAGLAKSIGVSNFNESQIERVLKIARIKPVVNQVECNPYFNQKKLISFCQERDIRVMAYSPLFNGKACHDPVIVEIARKLGKSAGQIIVKYLMRINAIPIPKSDKLSRMKEFIDMDFELTDEDVKKIDALAGNTRYVGMKSAKDFKEFPFKMDEIGE